MSATQTPLSNLISKLYQFYFFAALVFERHGLYPNMDKILFNPRSFPWVCAKYAVRMHHYFRLFVDAVDTKLSTMKICK